jgi:hypothetical protein
MQHVDVVFEVRREQRVSVEWVFDQFNWEALHAPETTMKVLSLKFRIIVDFEIVNLDVVDHCAAPNFKDLHSF